MRLRVLFSLVISAWVVISLAGHRPVAAKPLAQATEAGPRAEVIEGFANVRAGPGTDYDLIGTMILGQSEAILGKATVGDYMWLKVVYFGGPDNAGWVLAGLMRVTGGDLSAVPDLAIPPTPTRPPTATLSAFGLPETELTPGEGTVAATAVPGQTQRPPTFTPPVIGIRPTLLPAQGVASGGGFPPALAIIVLFVMGVFAGAVSLIRNRG
jgi:hypothetical protein